MTEVSRLVLRKYQEADVLDTATRKRVLNISQVGTGKTVIATRTAELVEEGGVSRHNVVLVKAHLAVQWIRHLEREGYGQLWGPNTTHGSIASIVVRSTRNPNRFVAATKEQKIQMLDKHTQAFPWYVLTYSTIRRQKDDDAAQRDGGLRTAREAWSEHKATTRAAPPARRVFEYPLPPCDTLIIDESSMVRNRGSQQFKGAYQLAHATKRRKAADLVIELTADPIWREPDDVYAQLRLLDRVKFPSYWHFVEKYCLTEEGDYAIKIIGARPSLARAMAPYTIRRSYGDPEVNIPVPDIHVKEVWTNLSPAGDKAYQAAVDDVTKKRRAGYAVGSGIPSFAKVTAHDSEKLKALKEVIDEDIRPGEPYALFAWYHDTIDLLASRLQLPSFRGGQGGASKSNRFTRGDEIKAAGTFVASIGCIQEGIDLSHLRYMLFFEADWTPGAMNQVKGRLARWRQDNSTDPIKCYFFLASGTIDEVVYYASTDRGATAADVEERIMELAKA